MANKHQHNFAKERSRLAYQKRQQDKAVSKQHAGYLRNTGPHRSSEGERVSKIRWAYLDKKGRRDPSRAFVERFDRMLGGITRQEAKDEAAGTPYASTPKSFWMGFYNWPAVQGSDCNDPGLLRVGDWLNQWLIESEYLWRLDDLAFVTRPGDTRADCAYAMVCKLRPVGIVDLTDHNKWALPQYDDGYSVFAENGFIAKKLKVQASNPNFTKSEIITSESIAIEPALNRTYARDTRVDAVRVHDHGNGVVPNKRELWEFGVSSARFNSNTATGRLSSRGASNLHVQGGSFNVGLATSLSDDRKKRKYQKKAARKHLKKMRKASYSTEIDLNGNTFPIAYAKTQAKFSNFGVAFPKAAASAPALTFADAPNTGVYHASKELNEAIPDHLELTEELYLKLAAAVKVPVKFLKPPEVLSSSLKAAAKNFFRAANSEATLDLIADLGREEVKRNALASVYTSESRYEDITYGVYNGFGAIRLGHTLGCTVGDYIHVWGVSGNPLGIVRVTPIQENHIYLVPLHTLPMVQSDKVLVMKLPAAHSRWGTFDILTEVAKRHNYTNYIMFESMCIQGKMSRREMLYQLGIPTDVLDTPPVKKRKGTHLERHKQRVRQKRKRAARIALKTSQEVRTQLAATMAGFITETMSKQSLTRQLFSPEVSSYSPPPADKVGQRSKAAARSFNSSYSMSATINPNMREIDKLPKSES